MQLTGLIVPLAPAGTVRRLERQNQLNFSVKKTFRVNTLEVAPEFSLFNALNADTILNESSANFGTPTFAFPSSIIQGRLPRLGVRIRW
jgi:hypothetical protein